MSQQILNKVRDLDAHDVDAAKEALSSFFPNLAKHKDSDCVRWLRALENVINRFPKLCGSQRGTIEKYITSFLDCNSSNTVIEAAKCAHVLEQVRPGQEKASTPKVCWRDLMSSLCNAVHSLISEIFPNAANIYSANGEQENKTSDSILLSALSEISVVSGQGRVANREHILCTRLRNVFIFIQAMLVEIYPVAKPVRPQQILDAVVRALASAVAGSCELVAAVKRHALRTLDALVACLGSNLIPFSPLVFKCVMQTLRWSSENLSEETSAVRAAAYGSLCAWLRALRCARPAARGWPDQLAAHVAADLAPPARPVQLAMSNPPRNLSKKQKKKQARMMLEQSSIATFAPGTNNAASEDSNDEVAIAALECTEMFLTVCGIFLKPAIHKMFLELLAPACWQLERHSEQRALALLRALDAARRGGPAGAAPAQLCLQLYSRFTAGSSPEISKFCSQALLDIRLHLHCSPPGLNFAHEPPPAKRDAEEKRMSRRNREALESLLGADRVPPEACDVEDAPEPVLLDEEPVNKKPRIDDDKISLSSGSEASVEICDSDSEGVEEVPMDDSIEVTTMPEDTVEVPNLGKSDPETNYNTLSIHEATTQMQVDTVDGESLSGRSNEVGYGCTTATPVAVLENLDDENLPNTNDTDDIHITCGQVAVSPEGDKEPKVNGVKSPEESPEKVSELEGSVTVKMAVNNDGVSVEEMLADFVDEVNDQNTTQA